MKIPGLNLLPPERKELLDLGDMLGRWRPGLVYLFVIGLCSIGALFGAEWWLQQRIDTLGQNIKTKIQLNSRQGALDIGQATVRVNEKAALLSQSLPQARDWAASLHAIISAMPKDVSIVSIDITQTGGVTIKGVAKTRAIFLDLDSVLKASPRLKNVATSDTASKREQLPFTYTATLVDPS